MTPTSPQPCAVSSTIPALGFLRDAATEVLASGTYEKFARKFSYAELNDFFPAETTDPKHFRR